MPESSLIPMFPLTLLPLPGELVPLHIFEPRYKQLLNDTEAGDTSFGIYCNHDFNRAKVGSLMKLESVIKRYPTGEADIIVRCVDIFTMDKLYRTYINKMYPGGDVQHWNSDQHELPAVELYELFLIYQSKRNINKHFKKFTTFEIALELNLDLYDRYKFLMSSSDKRANFLEGQLKFQIHVLRQEEKSKDVFHLN
jgi:hypothetical protein